MLVMEYKHFEAWLNDMFVHISIWVYRTLVRRGSVERVADSEPDASKFSKVRNTRDTNQYMCVFPHTLGKRPWAHQRPPLHCSAHPFHRVQEVYQVACRTCCMLPDDGMVRAHGCNLVVESSILLWRSFVRWVETDGHQHREKKLLWRN